MLVLTVTPPERKNDAHDTIITGTNQGFTIETAHREAMNGDLRP